jgi:hypothetical protein
MRHITTRIPGRGTMLLCGWLQERREVRVKEGAHRQNPTGGSVMRKEHLRVWLPLLTAATAVSLLSGCTTASDTTGVVPSASATAHLTEHQQQAIAAGRSQAAAEHATAQPTSVATNTIQAWPALDHGSRVNATGPATKLSPGVYSYSVQPDDVNSVIALRFGLCTVDVVDPASASGMIQPGDTLLVERRMTQPDANNEDEDDHNHEGWRCNYGG